MPIKIKAETFKAEGVNYLGMQIGTVEVECGREVLVCKASRATGSFGEIVNVGGFIGRYRTSNKPWMVSLSVRSGGFHSFHFGRDERSGRCQTQSGISYEPELYFKLCNPEFYKVVEEEVAR